MQYSRFISALAETGDFVRFRVKGGVVVCPAVAEGQHLDTVLPAASPPLGRGVHGLEESKEIFLAQTVQLVLIGRLWGNQEIRNLILFHIRISPLHLNLERFQEVFTSLSLSIYIIPQKYFSVK